MLYVIKSQKLAAFIMSQGIRLERTDVDRQNTKMNVFLFVDSEKLRECMSKYKK